MCGCVFFFFGQLNERCGEHLYPANFSPVASVIFFLPPELTTKFYRYKCFSFALCTKARRQSNRMESGWECHLLGILCSIQISTLTRSFSHINMFH